MNTKSMYVFSCITVMFLPRSPWSRMAANCCSASASSNIAMGLSSRPTTPEARDLSNADASTAMASAQIIAAIKTTQSNRSIWPTLRIWADSAGLAPDAERHPCRSSVLCAFDLATFLQDQPGAPMPQASGDEDFQTVVCNAAVPRYREHTHVLVHPGAAGASRNYSDPSSIFSGHPL